MVLKEKERSVIEDLQNQEKSCMEKYAKYAGLAKDPELKALFKELHKQEQKHYDSFNTIALHPDVYKRQVLFLSNPYPSFHR